MLHHISLPVSDLTASCAMYGAALAALGYRIVAEGDGFVGFGLVDGQDILALKRVAGAQAAGPGFHLAFAAGSRVAVDGFYQAALATGARDNGKPGLRQNYEPDYYAAFVIDPDGHRLEAVCKEAADV
jgi:catechol 2,3-dioxygenase-like lactoylglutathione lyase family enzyme